jgi:hypothetical protein
LQRALVPIKLLQLVDSNTAEARLEVRSSFCQWKSRPTSPPVESRINKTRCVATAESGHRYDRLSDHIAAFVRSVLLQIVDKVLEDKNDDVVVEDGTRRTLANIDRVDNYIWALKQVSVRVCILYDLCLETSSWQYVEVGFCEYKLPTINFECVRLISTPVPYCLVLAGTLLLQEPHIVHTKHKSRCFAV